MFRSFSVSNSIYKEIENKKNLSFEEGTIIKIRKMSKIAEDMRHKRSHPKDLAAFYKSLDIFMRIVMK